MNVAFQGVHGAYSELAAREILGLRISTTPCATFEQVFTAVEKGKADRGLVPIENSLAGSIHQNYDLLLAHRLHIVGETYLRIEHVLACHPRSNLRKLLAVRSHPQALAQCSEFFRKHPSLLAEPYYDTAGAAESIAGGVHREIGAIAGEYAARLYGLRILKRNIENSQHNFTRFLVIARTPWHYHRTSTTRTSIVITPAENRPGILFHILGAFALRGIDLLKIESRPDPRSPFQYLFYVDLAGGPHEQRVARAFDHLREIVSEFRILGTYPASKAKLDSKRR